MKLRHLKILHVPGLDRLSEVRFDDGINVIIGPNTSGKSTIASLVQASIWPKNTAVRGEAILRWQKDGGARESLEVKIGADRKDGLAVAGSDFPARRPECYVLRVGDLMSGAESHAGLSTRIQRELAGGLDLTAWKARTRRKLRAGLKEKKALAGAEAQLRRESRRQEELEKDEFRLDELRRRQKSSLRARQDVVLLENRLRLFELNEKLQELQRNQEARPAALGHMRGDEQETLEQLRRDLSDKKKAHASARRERERIEARLENLGLGMSRIPDAIVGALQTCSASLRQLAVESEGAQKNLEAARSQLRSLAPRRVSNTEAASPPSPRVLRQFSNLMQKAQRNAVERRVLGEQLDPAEEARVDFSPSMVRGRRLLASWLALADPQPTTWPSTMRLAVLIGVAASVAGFAVENALWGLAGLAFVVGLVANRLFSPDPAPSLLTRKAEIAGEFAATGLRPPARWERSFVVQEAEELDKIQARAETQRTRAAEQNTLRNRLAVLEADARLMREEALRFSDEFGLHLGDDPPLEIVTHFENLRRIQDVSQVVAAEEGALAHLRQTVARQQARASETLDNLGIRAAEDGAALLEQLSGISEDIEVHQVEVRTLEHQLRLELSLKNDVEDLVARSHDFFENLGLRMGQDGELSALLRFKPEFDRTQSEISACRHQIAALKSHLESDEDFADLNAGALRLRLAETRREAGELDSVIAGMVEAESRLAAAKRGNDLADALRARDICADNLAGVRREQIDLAVQSEIIDLLAEYQMQHTESAVLKRAVQLFSGFTASEWEMVVEPGAGFRARETASGAVRNLDELSTGTRMQLIMAARLAFVESQEEGEMLPLFLDEVLSSSDGRRRAAITRALATIAASGRQLIYMTVDPHDIVALRAAASEARLPFHVVELPSPASPEQSTGASAH